MKAIPVGRTGVGTLYFVVDGESTAFIIDKNKKTHNIDFLSFIARKPVKRIMSSEFHEFLWNGVDSPNDKWRNIVEYRVQPIPESMISGVDFIDKTPKLAKKSYVASVEEKDERAMEFKSLVASGNNEKALGRALRRSARWGTQQATGGVRGFIRGAVFDPNAEDADGDGFVQEGTQFARRVGSTSTNAASRQVRRAKKVRRAQERLADRQKTGLRSRRDYLPRTSRERFVQRSKEHYRKIYDEDTKRVLEMFHGGKPIETYGDLKAAMMKAHPGFRDGSSTADYLMLDDNENVSSAHYEHAMGFMLALSWNPRLKDAKFTIESSDTKRSKGENVPKNADGSTGYRGRQRVKITPNGVEFEKSTGKPAIKFDLMYQEKVSYDQVGRLDLFGNFQLETHKMFFTMLEDVKPETIPDPSGTQLVPNPDFDSEAAEAWAEARRIAQRNITVHEMGHVAHHVASMDDALRSAGLGVDGDLTILDLKKRIKDHVDLGMSDNEVIRALRERLLGREYSKGYFHTLMVMELLQQRAPSNADFLRWGPIIKADGSGPIAASKGLADFMNSVGRNLFPNPTGSRWREGDPITWDAIESIFGLSAGGGRFPIFSDRDMPYTTFLPWKGRVVAPLLQTVQGQVVPSPDIAMLVEHGLPRTPMTPAISPEDIRPLVEGMMRMGDIAGQMVSGRPAPDMTRQLRVPMTGGRVIPQDLLTGKFAGIDARELLLEEAMMELQKMLDGAISGSASPNVVRQILESFFSLTKRFDDLTPGEREIVRAIAELGTQGQWASYMAAHIAQDWDVLFDFHDMELFAEIAAANGTGNEIFLRWGSGTRPLNDSERAVIAKVHKWLFPDAPIRFK
jgi:hypothetical protein